MTNVKFKLSLPQFIFPLAFGVPLIAFGLKIYGSNGDPFAYPLFVLAFVAFTPMTIRKVFAFDLQKKQILCSSNYLGMKFFKSLVQITDRSEFVLTDQSAAGPGNQKAVTINLAVIGRLLGPADQKIAKHDLLSHHSKYNKTAMLDAVHYLAEQWNVPVSDRRSFR